MPATLRFGKLDRTAVSIEYVPPGLTNWVSFPMKSPLSTE
jgi:hypothetical protein